MLTVCLLWIKYSLAISCLCRHMSTFPKSPLMSCGWWMAWLGVPQEIWLWSSDKSLRMPCPRTSTACSMCRTSIDRNPLQSKCYPNINTSLDFLILFFSSSIYNLYFALAQFFEILLGCSPILSYTNIYMHLYFVKRDLDCLCWTSETVPLWSSPLVPGLRGGQPVRHAPRRILADSARRLPASPRNTPYCHTTLWPSSATFCE